MIWKSAPNANTLPLTASPRTSPPRIGMIRRTPLPVSPAVVTSPMRTVSVKTYLVASSGILELPHHALRQPQRQYRKCNQDHKADQVGDDERRHALKNRGE